MRNHIVILLVLLLARCQQSSGPGRAGARKGLKPPRTANSRARRQPPARPPTRGPSASWRKVGALGVPEVMIDPARKSILVRILRFSSKCLTKDPDVTCPTGCCQGSSLDRTKMSDSLSHVSLADGKAAHLRQRKNVTVPSEGPLAHTLLDVSAGHVLESIGKGSVVRLTPSATASRVRWAVPGGAVVEDGVVLDARTFVVAVRSRKNSPLAPRVGRLLLFSNGRVRGQKKIRAPGVLFEYMNAGTTAAIHFHSACLQGRAAICKRGRGHIRYGKGPIRPERIRLAYCRRTKTLAVFAFGDLLLFGVKAGALTARAHVKSAFYRDRDWYIRGGVVAIAPGGGRVAIGGASGLVRIYDGRGRLKHDYLEPSRPAAQLWPASRPSHLAFRSRRELLVCHGATVFRVDAKGKAKRWFSLVDGRARKSLTRPQSPAKTWMVDKLEVVGRDLVLMAAGRLIVLDAKTLKIRGWIGPAPGMRLGLSGLVGG